VPYPLLGKLEIAKMMPFNEGVDARKQFLSPLILTCPTSEYTSARVRPTAQSHFLKQRWWEQESCYLGPATGDCQSEYQDHDGCCTEQACSEDCPGSAFAASLSNNVVEQSDQGILCPLALIDTSYSGPLDPFATYPSTFPAEMVNSCLMYRKY
jgi:hypothetical protein